MLRIPGVSPPGLRCPVEEFPEGAGKRNSNARGAQDRMAGMGRFFRRLLVVAAATAAAYLLWPRSPSLAAFRPAQIEALRAEALDEARAGNIWSALAPLYRIFQEEFHFPPIAAGRCAWEASRALRLFFDSADNADRERALDPLEKMFAVVKSETGADFDAAVVARLQLYCWMLAGDTRKETQLKSAIAEKLALLHGGSAPEFAAAAAAFARADRLLLSKHGGASRQVGVSAWRRLSEQLKSRGGD